MCNSRRKEILHNWKHAEYPDFKTDMLYNIQNKVNSGPAY